MVVGRYVYVGTLTVEVVVVVVEMVVSVGLCWDANRGDVSDGCDSGGGVADSCRSADCGVGGGGVRGVAD